MKNVLFIASEAVPSLKQEVLADVVGSLPSIFNKDEFDVRVMIPKYIMYSLGVQREDADTRLISILI